jgi:hypothetical protein
MNNLQLLGKIGLTSEADCDTWRLATCAAWRIEQGQPTSGREMTAMRRTADPHGAVEPYACLLVLVVRHWDHVLTPRVSQAQTQVVAQQITACTATSHLRPGTTRV